MLGNLGSYVAQQFTWRPIGSGSQTDKLRLCQIRRETKNLFLKSSVGVNGWEENMLTISPPEEPQQQFVQQSRAAIFSPVLNHSLEAPTELLSIHQAPPHPRQVQQKAF